MDFKKIIKDIAIFFFESLIIITNLFLIFMWVLTFEFMLSLSPVLFVLVIVFLSTNSINAFIILRKNEKED